MLGPLAAAVVFIACMKWATDTGRDQLARTYCWCALGCIVIAVVFLAIGLFWDVR